MAGRTLQEDNRRFNGIDPVADSGLALDQCESSLFNETVLPKFPSLMPCHANYLASCCIQEMTGVAASCLASSRACFKPSSVGLMNPSAS